VWIIISWQILSFFFFVVWSNIWLYDNFLVRVEKSCNVFMIHVTKSWQFSHMHLSVSQLPTRKPEEKRFINGEKLLRVFQNMLLLVNSFLNSQNIYFWRQYHDSKNTLLESVLFSKQNHRPQFVRVHENKVLGLFCSRWFSFYLVGSGSPTKLNHTLDLCLHILFSLFNIVNASIIFTVFKSQMFKEHLQDTHNSK